MTVTKRAYCKINLTLEILGRARSDGFHDLKTVMHKIPLGDIIEVCVCDGDGSVTLSCDKALCDTKDNLAYKAAKVYLEAYSKNTGRSACVDIKLTKITPAGAGLGGGSADAAAVLDALYECIGGVTEEEVLLLACGLGSDVPFCLERYTCAYCTGRGEVCREISRLPKGVSVVIAKPVEGINTKGIYGVYDEKFGDDYTKSRSDDMEKALLSASLSAVAGCITNDFECVCIPRLPEIETLKQHLISLGAVCSQMSGSGSAVFGLFDSEEKARSAKESLDEIGLSEVFVFFPRDFKEMYGD